MAGWWRDVIREFVVLGNHTPVVKLHLRYGMVLFIASEVMFFVAWFWAYFNSALFSTRCLDRQLAAGRHHHARSLAFPAAQHADPAHLGHHGDLGASRHPDRRPQGRDPGPVAHRAARRLVHLRAGLRIHPRAVHLRLQPSGAAPFTDPAHISLAAGAGNFDAIYGSTFFMATGFHGFHVIIGTIFLTVCLFRAIAGQFTPTRHFGFEAAAWYWHFVDVVWLFLFACIYVWGQGPITAA